MGYKKKKIPKSKKPRRPRRKQANKHLTHVPIRNMGSTFPPQISMKLRYWQNGVNTTTVTAGVTQFYGNNIYDPDYTGAGHQPLYRDFWATAYNNYRVTNSYISITAVCTSGACEMVVYPQTETTTGTTTAIDSEKNYAKSVILSSGGDAKTIRHKMDTCKMYGITSSTFFGDPGYQSVISGGPENAWYWSISLQHPDQSTSQTTSYKFEIVYDVILYARSRQSQS